MGFVERLRQELALEAQRVEQKSAQEKADQEAKEKARLQAEVTERERRAPRRQQAEDFRKESGVGAVIVELGGFLATPTIPITRRTTITDGGDAYEEGFTGRGSSTVGLGRISLVPKDTDSVFDCARWDTIKRGSSKAKDGGLYAFYTHLSEKYIAVETCPNGTIVFHAGWFGGTTLGLIEWRNKNKKELFDRALEKAYKDPGINTYSVPVLADYSHKG